MGRRLQEIRGSRDQRTFAEAVDSVQQTISKYERGEIPRSWLFLARLAEEEGVDLNRLVLGERQNRRSGEAGPEGATESESAGGKGGNNGGGSEHRSENSQALTGTLYG